MSLGTARLGYEGQPRLWCLPEVLAGECFAYAGHVLDGTYLIYVSKEAYRYVAVWMRFSIFQDCTFFHCCFTVTQLKVIL